MTKPAATVRKIHFEDLGGTEFERLVFAYHVRAGWQNVSWYGQSGGDSGRDVVGDEPTGAKAFRKTIIQCANRAALTKKKALEDLQKAAKSQTGGAKGFKFVGGKAVSAKMRDEIVVAAKAHGFASVTIWSGVELEEHLRLIGGDLLRRFFEGEVFPDDEQALRKFAEDFGGLTDRDLLELMAAVFDRPAFRTPFQQECSIPAFQQAIEDTISALNTGLWRNREGQEIRRIPSIHHLRDRNIKGHVANAAQLVDQLRRIFVQGLRDRAVRPCGCGEADCPVFTMDHGFALKLDDMRSQALDAFRKAYPQFDVRLQ